MSETKNKTDKRHLYDGIRLSKKGADVIVISLSVFLFIFIIIAIIVSG